LPVLAMLVGLAGWLSGPTGVVGASTHHGAGPGRVYFREVLCYAPPYSSPSGGGQQSLPFPACSPSSLVDLANLKTTPGGNSPDGFTTSSVPPDAALATVRSTSAAHDGAAATVILPGLRGASGSAGANERYVLGPAQMSSRAIAHASASKNQTGAWVVDYTTTSAGAAVWDKVAEENFHLVLAVDLDGVVVWAPIIQPTQSSFSSFDGRGEISGNLTRNEAMRLARAL
jgi:hypothetical protein